MDTLTGVLKTNYKDTVRTDSTSYTWTGLKNGTTYYFVITTENTYEEGNESEEVVTTPYSVGGWTMLKLPDTGQTTSYTSTFDEDSDYIKNPPSYTDNGNETVTDNVTGLMWQQQDDDKERIWDEAISYCYDLTIAGYSDWRLPSDIELMSIVNYEVYTPAIDSFFFLNTKSSGYWSFTTYAGNSSYAWYVPFTNGTVLYSDKSGYNYVRCVRGGK